MKILTVDIGNTTINFGVFRGAKLALSFSLPTHKVNNSVYGLQIRKIFSKYRIRAGLINKVIICSVVPKKTKALKLVFHKILKTKVEVVGSDIKIPIKNRYKFPSQVGQDRLVCAYAVLKKFGPGFIVVDFGTAVTFDVVSKKGEYLGGLIFPGLDLSLDALYLKAALLPRIKIKDPKSLIGIDTVNSINSGIVFGMAGVCDAIIDRLLKKFKGYKIIATGGNINFIKRYSKKIKTVKPFLSLEGLRLLATL